MKKVVILIPRLTVGGAQNFVLNLCKQFIGSKDLYVQIICLGKNNHSIFDLDAEKNGIEVVYLNMKNRFDLRIVPRLISTFQKIKPDVIHCNIPYMHYYLPAIIISHASLRFYTFHNPAQKENINWVERLILKFAFRYCHVKPVAISEFCRKSITESYGIPENDIPCIYNGIDINKFKRCEKYVVIPDEMFRFIAVGRLSPQKDYQSLLEAFNTIHLKYPTTQLTILGDGELRISLNNYCAENGLEDVVSFMGNVKNVNEYLWKSQAYILSSNYEGLPFAVLEAMAAGLPIISTRAGGVIDIVENEKNGFLIDCGDVSGLVRAMEKLLNSPELCHKFSENNIIKAQEYSIQNCADQYRALYLGQINNKKFNWN